MEYKIMRYVMDISCLDTYASGAKQRFLNLYSQLILENKKKNFLIIYTSFEDIKIFFNYPNVIFKKNIFEQDSYLKKIISTFYIFLYLFFNSKKIKSIEYFTLPFFKIDNCNTVFTIHDLRRIYFSNSFFKKFLYKFFFKFFLKRANNIIVVSNAIKKEILGYFNKLKVTVIYNTIDIKPFKKISSKDMNSVKKKYNLPKKFILTVGHQEERKNYLRLIKSIKILKENRGNIHLIIVGQKADETSKIRDLINNLKLNSNIKIFTHLNDYELRCFYKLSSLFVFPSIYEGFGIPILESMATNTPMVLSNTEIFKEITENKYIYFNQYDPLSIATKINYVLSDEIIRKRMINYGKKRIINFTLKEQKKNIVNLYSKI